MSDSIEERSNLEALLEEARNRGPLTEEELQAQRESWVRGQEGLVESDREYARERGLEGD